MTAMPNWEGFMRYTLMALQDGVTRPRQDVHAAVASLAGLTPEQMSETLAQGDLRFANRIGWALSFLANVGALERPTRAHYRIAQPGLELLARTTGSLKERDFKAFAEDPTYGIKPYTASVKVTSEVSQVGTPDSIELDPIEQIEQGIQRISTAVSAELLERLRAGDPAFFERAVVKLLLAMGYGGAEARAHVTPLSGDEGIDGIIDSDALGLNRVYIQAKRYAANSSVGRPTLQAFVGALSGKGDRGVFITTSRFTSEAIEYADRTPLRVVLIDGPRLAALMIKYEVGVQVTETYHAVEVDEDFFE